MAGILHGTSLAQRNVQDHSHPHFSASGKWKHSEGKGMIGTCFPLKAGYCASYDQCMVKFDELYYNHKYLPEPCFSTPKLPVYLYKFEPVLRPERQGQPCWKEKTIWHKNMEQPEPAVEWGPAGCKEQLAWNWWHQSQSRDGANQKGGEEQPHGWKESQLSGCPHIQINPIPQWSGYKKFCFVST